MFPKEFISNNINTNFTEAGFARFFYAKKLT
jgi:hypothetical protein